MKNKVEKGYRSKKKQEQKFLDDFNKSFFKTTDKNISKSLRNISFETDDKDDRGQPIPIPKSVKNNNDTEFKSKKLNSFKLIMIICFCLALISIIIYINTSDEKTLTSNSQSNSKVIVPKNNEFTTFTLHLIKKGKVEYNIDFTETLTNISKSKFNKVTETCMKAFNNSNDNVCFNLLKSLKTQ